MEKNTLVTTGALTPSVFAPAKPSCGESHRDTAGNYGGWGGLVHLTAFMTGHFK